MTSKLSATTPEATADQIIAEEMLAARRRHKNPRRTHRQILIGSLLSLVAGLVIIQLIPVGSRTNPPTVVEPNWDSLETRALAQRACFDCHSNETVWPWYSYVAPVSWMVVKDVHEGRRVFNLSEWTPAQQAASRPEETVELVSKNLMPLPYYITLHPEADLTNLEKGQLINGLIATFTQSGEELDAANLEKPE
ncbi:MAG: heme-binding domain-containing protein [Caldilineaceae bacterium]|nr:heme-binding domain-containing protein [Caldilineaceae bacterium]